jgi:hypothetical protein
MSEPSRGGEMRQDGGDGVKAPTAAQAEERRQHALGGDLRAPVVGKQPAAALVGDHRDVGGGAFVPSRRTSYCGVMPANSSLHGKNSELTAPTPSGRARLHPAGPPQP